MYVFFCSESLERLCSKSPSRPRLAEFNHDNRQGGANASIRFEPEINHTANAGLVNGLGLLEPVKEMFDEVGWSDLIQMASVTAIEVAGEKNAQRAWTNTAGLDCCNGMLLRSETHPWISRSAVLSGKPHKI